MEGELRGLSQKEVESSRAKHGSNQLTKMETESLWKKFIGNFEDPMIKILIVALVINIVFVFLGQTAWYESLGIAAAVLIATLVSTLSEYKNEATFQKLQEDAARIKCKVYREGSIQEILIDDIVVGDYVLLQTGDKVPADGIIFRGSLKVDQATLNGESEEAKKVAITSDEPYDSSKVDYLNPHEVFRGTVVCSGEAILRVEMVGDASQYGKLAKELGGEDRQSPLQVKLAKLAEGISKFGYMGGTLIAIAFMFQKVVLANAFNGEKILQYFTDWQGAVADLVQAIILAIIVVVVAVPEGLPMMIAMVLSMNMRKMLKDNILVRKLIGIETAGSLNILFSDKTGTITKGELQVVHFMDGTGKQYGALETIESPLQKLLTTSLVENTSAVLSKDKGIIKSIGGNATERALLQYVGEAHLKANTSYHKVTTIPFSSDKKYSAVQVEGDLTLTLIKGAPEKILTGCKFYYDSNGEKQPLQDITQLNIKMDELAGRAMRMLAIATTEEPLGETVIFKDLTLVGILAIRDEVRPESIKAIDKMNHAGVQVVMVTGDKKETATAIAREVGLLKEKTDLILDSYELNQLSDEKLKEILKDIRVIARALPTDKSRLVHVAQQLDWVVGMTGDGVNDAPALKKADVGFAMGSGTEVAKEVGDIVVLDDNFNSIGKAVLYGRTIYNNIKKFIVYQLTVNAAAISIAFLGPFIGVDLPLTMTQMLWVNLIMDTLAALAFGGEAALERYMFAKPIKRDQSIINQNMWSAIGIDGAFITIMSLFFLKAPLVKNFFRASDQDLYLLTGFFTLFILMNTFNAFNARTPHFNLFKDMSRNTGFIKVMLTIFITQFVIVCIGGEVLRTAPLTSNEWLFVVGLALFIIPVDLLRKMIIRGLYIMKRKRLGKLEDESILIE